MSSLLEVRDVTAGYGGSAVLQNVSLDVRPGTVTGIIGPNGSGKSTLLKAILGYVRITSGEVSFGGRPISRARTDERIRSGIAYVGQSRNSFPDLTVLENLRLGGYLIRDRAVVKQRLADVFRRFPDLEAKRAVPAGLLSGGQLRMLEIGRFLMTDPRLVVLDEPSIGLAPLLVDFVYAQIGELRGEDRTFLIVEQNVRKLLSLADYVYALETGRNRYRGTPQRLVEEGHLAGLYLGLPGLGRVGASSP